MRVRSRTSSFQIAPLTIRLRRWMASSSEVTVSSKPIVTHRYRRHQGQEPGHGYSMPYARTLLRRSAGARLQGGGYVISRCNASIVRIGAGVQ